jgi:hypothetical protein
LRELQPHLARDAWFNIGPGEFRKLLDLLEWRLPSLIQEVDRWFDSFDGVCCCSARQGPDKEIEIVGLPILISSQTLVVMHLRVQIDPGKDAIRWLELKVGEEDQDGRTKKYEYHGKWPRMDLVKNSLNEIRWAYHVGLGERHAIRDAS